MTEKPEAPEGYEYFEPVNTKHQVVINGLTVEYLLYDPDGNPLLTLTYTEEMAQKLSEYFAEAAAIVRQRKAKMN